MLLAVSIFTKTIFLSFSSPNRLKALVCLKAQEKGMSELKDCSQSVHFF